MKCLLGFCLLIASVWPQVQTGSVIVLDFNKDEITVAADSRGTMEENRYADTQCKLAASGDKFVFADAGFSGSKQWNANDVARKMWEDSSRNSVEAPTLAHEVITRWTSEAEKFYRLDPEVLRAQIRLHPDNDVLSNAIVAATDNSGVFAVETVDITFDLPLFRERGDVRTEHEAHTGNIADAVGLGAALDYVEQIGMESIAAYEL